MSIELMQQALTEVRQAQEDTDVMSVWYALQELADYYEEELGESDND